MNIYGVTETDIRKALSLNYQVSLNNDKGFSFEFKNFNVWPIRSGWQTAIIDNLGVYTSHKKFDSLTNALEQLNNLRSKIL